MVCISGSATQIISRDIQELTIQFKNIELIQSMFSYHKGIKLRISKIYLKSVGILKLIKTGINSWLSSEIKLNLNCKIIRKHNNICGIQHKQCLKGMLCLSMLMVEWKNVLKSKI